MSLFHSSLPPADRILNLRFSLCAVASTLALFSACSNDAIKTASGMNDFGGYENQDQVDTNSDETRFLADFGDPCASSSACKSGICYYDQGSETFGICSSVCDSVGEACSEGFTCQNIPDRGLLCLPHIPESSEPDETQVDDPRSTTQMEEEVVRCEVAPNRQFVYLVDNELNIRSFDPTTEAIQQRGNCDLSDIFTAISETMLAEGYDDYDIDYNLDQKRFSVNSFAISSTGKGFISFSIARGRTSAYGVITIPNVNAVLECTTTVKMADNGYPVLTLSTAIDPNDGVEKLYGNFFTETRMLAGEVHEDAEISPSRILEINMDNTQDQFPLLSQQDFRLAELTQDSQGKLLSLYPIPSCHGDCREYEVGQPRPEGIFVNKLQLIEVDLTTETLGQSYPIEIPDPYNHTCGADCTYDTGHNIAILNDTPYLVYTQNSGQQIKPDNLRFTPFKGMYGSITGHSYLRKLEFDPATQTYVGEGESIMLSGIVIVGAASPTCR